ncbi:MAG: trans-2-enoyl-CoA reductase family protein [Sphingobacteriales bacterium]|nr:MAG: trans-2-enoyl-CoA reductase family protein [Sphingobacteriales bacterium]
MIIEPRMRGFICLTAHPDGCKENVRQQIEYVKQQGEINVPKSVLVIGASTGFGLASRIAAAYGSGAATIGVYFEKEASEGKTATPGLYNTAAFQDFAHADGLYAKSINGDAYSNEVKQQTIDLIKADLGQVDLVIYSLASPVRTDPATGVLHRSVLKPIGEPYTNKTVDIHTGKITDITINPATEEEIDNTIKVMGGEDWALWIDALQEAGALAEGAKTVAYSYIGPDLTQPLYRQGTIGRAKDHLEATAGAINEKLSSLNGKAFVSVNKALVTQSSAAIPVVPLYISLLYKVMKEKGTQEGCIEQIYRLYKDRLYNSNGVPVDEKGRIRVDDWEMQDEVQAKVLELWNQVHTENLGAIGDLQGYKSEFIGLFGFGVNGVDYAAEANELVRVNN